MSSFTDKLNAIYSFKYECITETGTKATLRCPAHGEIEVWKTDFLKRGVGCKHCESERVSRLNGLAFIASGDHGRYDYSGVEYVNNRTPVTIRCKQHNHTFTQRPDNHLSGREGCEVCAGKAKPVDTFMSELEAVNGGRYDTSRVIYVNNMTPIKLVCPKHGEWEVDPRSALCKATGCPDCGKHRSDKEEDLFNFVSSLTTDVKRRVRGVIGGKEIDILTGSVGIEYNGMHWHSTEYKTKNYHMDKRKACEDAGVRLITVWEADYTDPRKRPIIERYIAHAIGKDTSPRIGARKCTVDTNVPRDEFYSFLDANHIQGATKCGQRLGLRYNGDLVAVLGMRGNEVGRFATSCKVSGALRKLLARVQVEGDIVSFTDLDLFTGSAYEAAGFVKQGKASPEMRVWDAKQGYKHRQDFWGKSEELVKFKVIYTSGTIKLVLPR